MGKWILEQIDVFNMNMICSIKKNWIFREIERMCKGTRENKTMQRKI